MAYGDPNTGYFDRLGNWFEFGDMSPEAMDMDSRSKYVQDLIGLNGPKAMDATPDPSAPPQPGLSNSITPSRAAAAPVPTPDLSSGGYNPLGDNGPSWMTGAGTPGTYTQGMSFGSGPSLDYTAPGDLNAGMIAAGDDMSKKGALPTPQTSMDYGMGTFAGLNPSSVPVDMSSLAVDPSLGNVSALQMAPRGALPSGQMASAAPSAKSKFGFDNPLFLMGAGILGGNSWNFGQNVGQGLLAGAQAADKMATNDVQRAALGMDTARTAAGLGYSGALNNAQAGLMMSPVQQYRMRLRQAALEQMSRDRSGM